MKRLLPILALTFPFATSPAQAAEPVRVLEVTSIPLGDGSAGTAAKAAGTPLAKPSSAYSPPPFLTRQSAVLLPDGTLQMRCDGGSRHNFGAIQRINDPDGMQAKGARP